MPNPATCVDSAETELILTAQVVRWRNVSGGLCGEVAGARPLVGTSSKLVRKH